MLQLSNYLYSRPVLSLRTGGPIALALGPLINPKNLKIEGLYCDDSRSHEQLILLSQDIRDASQRGFIVDDVDVLTNPDDLVRLQDVLELNFELLKKPVDTINGDKVGKVVDYATEIKSMYVQKLYVSQPLWKNLAGGSLSVDRNQIQEVTTKRIIINDLLQPTADTAPAVAA